MFETFLGSNAFSMFYFKDSEAHNMLEMQKIKIIFQFRLGSNSLSRLVIR